MKNQFFGVVLHQVHIDKTYSLNFSETDYAMTHPAGQLGRNLILCVADVMHTPEKVAFVEPSTPLKDIVIKMTEKAYFMFFFNRYIPIVVMNICVD